MARGAWDSTAQQLALVANVNRDPKRRRRPFHPSEFHPFRPTRRAPSGIPITADNIHVLKALVPQKPQVRTERTG